VGIKKLEDLPTNVVEDTAVVHLDGRQYFVIYESDSPFDPTTFVAGTPQELLEAVRQFEN
jgi:hypothetical protein